MDISVLSMLDSSLLVRLVALVLQAMLIHHQYAPDACLSKLRIQKHQRDFRFFNSQAIVLFFSAIQTRTGTG